jgi:hypothetical protein
MDNQLLNIPFQDAFYLSHNLLNSPSAVLNYFTISPFFDRTSNNHDLFLQNIPQTPENLAKLRGIQYHIDESVSKPPHLYVIVKRDTTHSINIDLDMFYCFNGSIMRCASLKDILNCRFDKICYSLEKALQGLLKEEEINDEVENQS